VSNICKSILFSSFFLFSSLLFCQIDKEKKPLSDILIQLQEKYNYQFTYTDTLIKDIFIEPPSTDLNFEEVISYLKNKTGLLFQFLENNFIVINHSGDSNIVCGYLIDKELGVAIEGVSIFGKNNYAISDSFGYFELKLTKNDESITFRHLGFYPISKASNSFENNFCSNIYLTPQIETLSEIILTNYITRGIDKIADGTINLNYTNFGILPGLIETDVLQTVQALPGIQSINETVSDINIRGGTHDQNLILWDGIKMYQTGHFFGLISIFNPLITTQVSVTKNGTNVDLTEGVSGTISMKTDTKVNNSFSGNIGINFINSDGFVDVPIGKSSSIQVSARKAISDVLETPTYNSYFERIFQDTEVENNSAALINSNKHFDFYDTSMRWIYNITDDDQIRVNFLHANNELIFNENAIINQVEESKESSIAQISYAGGIFYKKRWSDSFVTDLQVYETDYELTAINSNILLDQRLRQENNVSETSIKLNSWFKFNNQLSFLNGYQFTETGITNLTEVDDPIFVSKVTEVIKEHGIYSQVNYVSNSQKTYIKAGIRYSYIEKFNKHIVEPRLSLNQKIFNHFTIELLGEMKHQNTSQIINFQNDFLAIEKRRWLLSNNDNIPIITSKQVSVGLNYSNKGWLISAEGYYKDVQGITSQSQGFLNQYIFERTNGSYEIKGIDLLINKKFKKISTWLSYSYGDNDYTFNDFEEINFPNNLDITHAVSIGTSYSNAHLKISAGFNWHSERPTTTLIEGSEIVNNELNYEPANNSRLKEYLRLDASAIYNFNLSKDIKAKVGVSLWNGLDQTNIINNYYKIDNGQFKEVKNKALGFTPNVTFRVQF
jgi:hypothetical protein